MKMRSLILIAATFLITAAQQVNASSAHGLEFAQQGENFFNAGNYAAAWAAFNEAIKLNPKEMLYYYMRATCSSKLGNYKDALTDYNMTMSLSKNNEEKGAAHFDLAVLYNTMGDVQSARFHLQAAARLGDITAQNVCKEIGLAY